MEKQLIFEKLCAINKEVEAVKKTDKNAQQGFMYRGIDSVMNELHSLFAKHGVVIISESIDRVISERATKSGGVLFYVTEKMKFSFYAEDGSFVSSIIDGEAMDSGDKATNKAMSIALKYCLLQMFLIPTVEDKDPDDKTPPELKPKPAISEKQLETLKTRILADKAKKQELMANAEKAFQITNDQYIILKDL